MGTDFKASITKMSLYANLILAMQIVRLPIFRQLSQSSSGEPHCDITSAQATVVVGHRLIGLTTLCALKMNLSSERVLTVLFSPQTNLNDRKLYHPRGKMLGGSTCTCLFHHIHIHEEY